MPLLTREVSVDWSESLEIVGSFLKFRWKMDSLLYQGSFFIFAAVKKNLDDFHWRVSCPTGRSPHVIGGIIYPSSLGGATERQWTVWRFTGLFPYFVCEGPGSLLKTGGFPLDWLLFRDTQLNSGDSALSLWSSPLQTQTCFYSELIIHWFILWGFSLEVHMFVAGLLLCVWGSRFIAEG